MFKDYYYLTKPGIIYGNAINTAAGFFLASQGVYNFKLLLLTLLGISLVVASACVFNNWFDRKLDAKMERTKNRALALGQISKKNAMMFGTMLLILGLFDLYLFTNRYSLFAALMGWLVYVFLYTFSKRYYVYGTEIGSIAGAVPPLVGYLSVSNRIDAGAVILFLIFVFWQMPHFYAIAIYRLKDYIAADIPVLSAVKGIYRTKINIFIYIIAFIATLSLLTAFKYTGYLYLIVMGLLGLAWLFMAILGLKTKTDDKWAKIMFKFSLVIVLAFCVIIPLDSLLR